MIVLAKVIIAEADRIYCLVGPNGAGKTTTLRMVVGPRDNGIFTHNGARQLPHRLHSQGNAAIIF